jgi:HEPN domain-containing protein
MISRNELRKIARARFKDAEILFAGRRFDGAIYLCGYAIELALKARICQTLKWTGFPSTNKEFEGYQSYKVHRLDILLSLSGQEVKIKTRYLADWSTVATWQPEMRYTPTGTATLIDAKNMIESAKVVMKVL